jgi:hypothetical protein
MRRLAMFAGLLAAAGAFVTGMTYHFGAMIGPHGHRPATASEIRSKATSDDSFLDVAKVGVPDLTLARRQ